MLVFKFGGASIETVDRARNLAKIVESYKDQPILLIISAKGKTTNALEKIIQSYVQENAEEALRLLHELQEDHYQYAKELLEGKDEGIQAKLKELFTEIEWVLQEPLGKAFDYYYDQVVCIGELLSTTIIHGYMNKIGMKADWHDVRGIIKTDDTYRDAKVLWEETSLLAKKLLLPSLQQHAITITQGFIGSTLDNNSVTLGREGSDYTAAIFANILDAESVTIWKDVSSLLNADPKLFPHTVAIPEITFSEVIEMAYYGAQVIHPKTIKPLQNKNITLYVKCFLDPSLPGTIIHNTTKHIHYPPIMVLKQHQMLLEVKTKDYSFITEDNLSKIYQLFHQYKIKINVIQNAAISFIACIDSIYDKMEALLLDLEKDYTVRRNENLFLFTVRHYTEEVLQEELKNRTVLLSQKTRQTIQVIAQ